MATRRNRNRHPPGMNTDEYKLDVKEPEFEGPDNSMSSIRHPRGDRTSGSYGTWIRGEIVGSGNFGTVYLERNPATNKLRAVKQLIGAGVVFRERELRGMLFGKNVNPLPLLSRMHTS